MHFLWEYLFFLVKSITVVLAILAVLATVIALASKNKGEKGRLEIKKLNECFDETRDEMRNVIFSKERLKEFKKDAKLEKKRSKKVLDDPNKKRTFVLAFEGDMKASAVKNLREEITAILQVATINDEVVLRVESAGGMVPHYGLAASQLKRLRDARIPLTAIVDRVAASGGYLMASVADKICAAPFAIIGSIGVIAQLPNFHKLLKKHNIDVEQIQAGEYKRTLTVFGENTSKGRAKFQQDIDETHELFKRFVTENRSKLDIDKVATGEYWYGTRAIELGLVDRLITSDDYLFNASQTGDVFEVSYKSKKKLAQKLSQSIKTVFENVFTTSSPIQS
ncbi:MAG: protease SohB [Gammaproteobacteria bacterium]|nr:protease SohB [Gammaproteobacteria bacterium]